MDVDSRKLRYFIAVAEELHFGRAAQRLHIAQPALSRQIRVLESEFGAALFERDRRGTALTSAGAALVADAKSFLVQAEALVRRVRAAGEGVEKFTVGFMPGITGAVQPELQQREDQHCRLGAQAELVHHRQERPHAVVRP
jgi:DNA-binding transcriptional LysR family regulator